MLNPSRCHACDRVKVQTGIAEARCLDHEDGLRTPLKATIGERLGAIGPVPRLMVGAPTRYTPPSFEEIILEPIGRNVVRKRQHKPAGYAPVHPRRG